MTTISALQPPLSFSGRAGLHDSEGRLLVKNLAPAELEEWCLSIGGWVAGWEGCWVGTIGGWLL
jgi:hypothetical protein